MAGAGVCTWMSTFICACACMCAFMCACLSAEGGDIVEALEHTIRYHTIERVDGAAAERAVGARG